MNKDATHETSKTSTNIVDVVSRLVEGIVKGAEDGSIDLSTIWRNDTRGILAIKNSYLGYVSFTQKGHLIRGINGHVKTYDLSEYLEDAVIRTYYKTLEAAFHKQNEKGKNCRAEKELTELSDILNSFIR